VLERIEVAGPDRRARRLVLSGADEDRITAAAVVRVLGLHEGMPIDSGQLADDLSRAEGQCARERALRVLGYRERSTHELTKRLSDDGYPIPVVAGLVSRLAELGLLDDERFARLFARGRVAAGYGPRRIVTELGTKGIERELAARAASEALADAPETESEVERARRCLGGSTPTTRQERDRALRKLIRRGYDMRTALAAIGPADQDE